MPRYNYYCENCNEYYELQHSMMDKLEECVNCHSSGFRRVPSIPAYIQKQKIEKDLKTGDLVEEYIKQNRKSVQQEKDRLKNKTYKESE